MQPFKKQFDTFFGNIEYKNGEPFSDQKQFEIVFLLKTTHSVCLHLKIRLLLSGLCRIELRKS